MGNLVKSVLAISFFPSIIVAVSNPSGFVLPAGFADPRSILYDGTYYAFATNSHKNSSKEPDRNVPVATSTSFSSEWTYSDANVLPSAGAWTASSPEVWDPAVYSYSDNHFVMYYAAIPKVNPKVHCIGVANASSILGRYDAHENYLICDKTGAGYISPNPFMYQGNPYIVYKAGAAKMSQIMLQQLTANGTALVGDPIELVHESGSEYDTEGPAMTFNPNNKKYPILLFVTGYYKNNTYKIQYATAPQNSLIPPKNQHYKVNSNPLLQTGVTNNEKVFGPGGPSFPDLARDPTQMTFMADRKNGSYIGRSMRTAILTYNQDNTILIQS